MAYSSLQALRRMRGKNKGLNKRLAASFRALAQALDKRGPEELAPQEIRALQSAREAITARLYANALAKGMNFLVTNAPKLKRNGKYVYDMKQQDL
jgi:hypothetical protein